MKNNALTDAGVGRALFATRFMLSWQAAKMCFFLGAIPGFLIPLLLWAYFVSAQNYDMAKLDVEAAALPAAMTLKWRVRDEKGDERILMAELNDGRVVQWLSAGQVRQLTKGKNPAADRFANIVRGSMLAALFGYILVYLGLRRTGAGNQQNKRIGGAQELVTGPELDKRVRSVGKPAYSLGGVAIPSKAPTHGILAKGAQGSGKSVALHDLLQQVLKTAGKKKKVLIYDQSGEFFAAYFRPGKDYFFNPAMEGSVPWSIFSELKHTYDSDTMAQAFLPPKGGVVTGSGAFFEDAARSLFSVLLLRLAQRGAVNTRDLARAFLEMPEDEMNHLIEKSIASSAIGGEAKAQRQGVLSSIAIYLNGISAVKPGSWSIREFLEGESDARFFILGSDDTRAMFSPLYRLMLTAAFDAIGAKQEICHEDRYWFFLDEAMTLGDIKLDEQLATKRKFGVSIVTGIQADTQVVSAMGKDRAETVMNCFNTVLLLNTPEPSMQERNAKRLGKVEMDRVSRNQALAVTESRDAAGLNKAEGEKWVVMPSDFGELGTCTGFLKVMGDLPPAKIDYSHWLPAENGWKAILPRSWFRASSFRAIQKLPKRDSSFVVLRSNDADPLGTIQAEVQRKKEDAEAQKEAGSGKAGTEGTGIVMAAAAVVPKGPSGQAVEENAPAPETAVTQDQKNIGASRWEQALTTDHSTHQGDQSQNMEHGQ